MRDEAADWNFPRGPAATQILLEVAREEGLHPSSVLAGTHLTATDLLDPLLVLDAGQELTAVRNLLHLAGHRPGLGVRAGRRATVGMLGIWGLALLSSRNTRGIIDIALRYGYGKFSWVFLRPSVEELVDETRIVYDDRGVPEDVRAFLTERDLTFTAALVPQIFGRQLPMRIVTTLAPASERAFRAALPGCDVTYGASHNAQVLTEPALAAILPRADPYALRISENQCEQLLTHRAHRTGIAAAVRLALLRHPGEACSLAHIARKRNVDPRTLRRQLLAEGTSFRELADEVHETLATELLAAGALSVEEVAERLAYADASSFTRAYKRWTGLTPGSRRTQAAPLVPTFPRWSGK